jgi:hypothetical protein
VASVPTWSTGEVERLDLTLAFLRNEQPEPDHHIQKLTATGLDLYHHQPIDVVLLFIAPPLQLVMIMAPVRSACS